MTAENGLNFAIHLNCTLGWACIPLAPYSKVPAIKGLFDNPPRTEAMILDAWSRAQFRIDHDRDHPEWHGLSPGIGVLLGASKLLQMDADTTDEVAAWHALCAENGYDAGKPTVLTPGARGVDGEMKHRDGGHWFFPQGDLDIGTGVVKLALGVGPKGGHAVLYGGRRLAVLPPTVRDTGQYVSGGGEIRPLPDFLRERITDSNSAAVRNAKPPFGVSGEYVATDQEWAWAEAMDWLDLLPDGWILTSEERDGHQVYARPGASSDRSAVAHVTGCSHFRNAKAPPPLTIHTSNPGDYLDAVVADRCPSSVSKLRMYALKHYYGDTAQARRALGFPTSSPPQLVSDEAAEGSDNVAESATETITDEGAAAQEQSVELPPPWQPADLGNRVAGLLLASAQPATPDVLNLITAAESANSNWNQRRAVSSAKHVPTDWLAELLGVEVSRARAIVRALLPSLYRAYGLIVRERLLDADPFTFGVRVQPADRTAWAVWRIVAVQAERAAS